MTKEEFLKKLKIKLSVLEESEVTDILEEYSEHIDEKMKAGVSESEAIKEFGNINELSSEILSAYKVNKDYSESIEYTFITDIVETAKEVFNKVVKILSHGTTRDIVKLVLYTMITLIIIAVLKIPFILLEQLFNRAFDLLPPVLEDLFNVITGVVINISYIILALLFLIKMLKEKLLDNYIVETEVTKETETKKKNKTKNNNKKEDLIIEKQIEKKIVYKNEKTFLDSFGDLLLVIVKAFAAFILIPCIVGIVFSAAGLALILLFSIKYYFLFGFMIICLGLLIGSIWLTELLFRFIANKKGSFLRSFITFIVALVLCGAGMGISFIELSGLRYEEFDKKPELLKTYEFDTDDYKKIGCWNCINIEKSLDETMKDEEYIVEVYGQSFQIPHYTVYESDNENDKIYFYSNTDDIKTFKSAIEEIKKGKIYDYQNSYSSVSLKIIANSDTLEDILISDSE